MWNENINVGNAISWQVLIRRAIVDDEIPGGYKIKTGQDVMISVYNIHHSPQVSIVAQECCSSLFEDSLNVETDMRVNDVKESFKLRCSTAVKLDMRGVVLGF